MWEAEISHFSNLIAHALPKEASIQRFPPVDCLAFSTDWPLNNDPTRTNKRSRKLNIIFPRELMADYTAAAPGEKESMLGRQMNFIAARLAGFNPNHDTPKDTLPPEETWVVPH